MPCGAALDLAVDDHRVDQHAGIFDHDVVQDFHAAGLGIDRARWRAPSRCARR